MAVVAPATAAEVTAAVVGRATAAEVTAVEALVAGGCRAVVGGDRVEPTAS